MPSSPFYFFSDSFSCFLFLIARRMAKMPNTAIAPTATPIKLQKIIKNTYAVMPLPPIFIVPFHVFRVINKPHFFSQKTTDEISPIRDFLFLTIPNDPIYQQDY